METTADKVVGDSAERISGVIDKIFGVLSGDGCSVLDAMLALSYTGIIIAQRAGLTPLDFVKCVVNTRVEAKDVGVSNE